jgi:hypothetical protein
MFHHVVSHKVTWHFRGACCLHQGDDYGDSKHFWNAKSVSARLHGATSQKTVIFILNAVRTRNCTITYLYSKFAKWETGDYHGQMKPKSSEKLATETTAQYSSQQKALTLAPKTEGSSLCSREPATGIYPEPTDSTPPPISQSP